jgi:AraC-like DNA-binding protein
MNAPYLSTHCRFVTSDLDEARDRVSRVWEQHDSRLVRGRKYGLRWHQADFGRLSLGYMHSVGTVQVNCARVGGGFRFAMPEQGVLRYRINGCATDATPVQGVVYAPRQDLQLTIEPLRSLLLTIDQSFVEQAAQVRFGRMPTMETLPNAISLDTPPAATLRSLCRWFGQEMDRPATPLLTSRRTRSVFERAILGLFLDCLAAYPALAGERCETLTPMQLRRVEEWLDAHFREPIGVEEMALVAGVSVRSVQGLFRRYRGCTPRDAIAQRRLAYARQRLIEADPQTTVTEVAFDAGFFHLSRFAAQYARRFGERPSATLGHEP